MAIRTLEKLVRMMDNKQKLVLNPSEKKHYKDMHKDNGGGSFNEYCPSCWEKILRSLHKIENPPLPKLYKEKMVQHDVSEYHVGGGYYDLPNGIRVRGKKNAIKELNK